MPRQTKIYLPFDQPPVEGVNGRITRAWLNALNFLINVVNALNGLTDGSLVVATGENSVGDGNLSGDVSTAGSTVTTLATVNGNVGTFGDATHVPRVTVNAKGLITAVSSVAISGSSGGGAGVPSLGGGLDGDDGLDGIPGVMVIPAPSQIGTVGITIDGGGVVITTGVKGFVQLPRAGTILAATLISTDASATNGSIVIDIWKDVYANYPPTVADTITAAAKPTLTAANKSQDTTLTGWTRSFAANDILGFKVDSIATLTRVTLQLTVRYA